MGIFPELSSWGLSVSESTKEILTLNAPAIIISRRELQIGEWLSRNRGVRGRLGSYVRADSTAGRRWFFAARHGAPRATGGAEASIAKFAAKRLRHPIFDTSFRRRSAPRRDVRGRKNSAAVQPLAIPSAGVGRRKFRPGLAFRPEEQARRQPCRRAVSRLAGDRRTTTMTTPASAVHA